MNNPRAPAIFRAVTNPLKNKYLLRTAWGVGAWFVLACGGSPERAGTPEPAPTAPLPTAGLAGQKVSLLPLTLVVVEDTLHWEDLVANRRATLSRGDSVIGTLLTARAPEVTWILPDELRRAARRAAGVADDPDQLGTAVLRAETLVDVPDPLRTQLRTLSALAGGRFVLAPAALLYRRTDGLADRRSAAGGARGAATAELIMVLVDVRLGKVGWRTVARGDGDDPWTALTRAVKSLTPGLP